MIFIQTIKRTRENAIFILKYYIYSFNQKHSSFYTSTNSHFLNYKKKH